MEFIWCPCTKVCNVIRLIIVISIGLFYTRSKPKPTLNVCIDLRPLMGGENMTDNRITE